MKRLSNYFFMLLAFVSVGFLASCSEDDGAPVIEGAPTVSIVGDPDPTFQEEAGETVSFTVEAEAPLGFNVFRVSKTIDGSNDISFSEEINKEDPEYTGDNTFTYPFSYTLQGSEIDKPVVFTFQVVDDEGNRDEIEVTVNTEAPAEETVSSYETFLLVPPAGDKTTKTFFATSDGTRYTVNEVNTTANTSPKVDFGYYFGVTTDKASFASPVKFPTSIFNLSEEGWNRYNATIFRRTSLTVSDFEDITVYDDARLSGTFELGTATTTEGIITNLEVDKIYAFKTDNSKVGGSKFGLIRVRSISEGNTPTDGINIEVKVEK